MTDRPQTPVAPRPVVRPINPPASGAIVTDGPPGACAENDPLPPALSEQPLDQKSPAEWTYQRLVLYIRKFEESLDAEHEVGLGLAGSNAGTLHIQGLGYFAPDIVTFYGRDQAGVATHLIQHVSQLNVMLKAAPKLADKPRRIGFALQQGLESAAASAAADGAAGADPVP